MAAKKNKAAPKKKAASKSTAKTTGTKKTGAANTASAEKAAAKATASGASKATGTKAASKKKVAKKKPSTSATKKKAATTTKKSATPKSKAAAKTAAKKTEAPVAKATKTAAKKAAAPKKKAASPKTKAGTKKTAKGKGKGKAAALETRPPIRKRAAVKKPPVVLLPRPTTHAKASADSPFKNYTPYEAKKNEIYMSTEQEDHFRSMLNNWRTELMEEVDRTVNHMQDEAANFPDPADRATQEEEFSIELRTRDRERKLIKKIDQTLERLEQQDYGFCDTCGVEIGLRRLEARPTATQCVDCKTLDELRERQLHG